MQFATTTLRVNQNFWCLDENHKGTINALHLQLHLWAFLKDYDPFLCTSLSPNAEVDDSSKSLAHLQMIKRVAGSSPDYE